MSDIVFAIPGDLNQPTGGYVYDRRVLETLVARGLPIRHLILPASFPLPSSADLTATARQLAALSADSVLLIDGLAFGALPREVLVQIRAPIVALVHHPLGYESGLAPQISAALIASERRALTVARHVIVTSPTTARTLVSDFGVDSASITVAVPGTDPAARARGSGTSPHLLAVGAVVPRKGYEVLAAALASLTDLDWTLTITGALDRSPETADALRDALATPTLASRTRLIGPLDRAGLAAAYDAADVFVMSSHYEGFGMVLTEALARGLPIVCTTGGAMAETVPDGAGRKVPPNQPGLFAAALREVIVDGALRKRLSDAAWFAGQRLVRWEETATRIATVLGSIGP